MKGIIVVPIVLGSVLLLAGGAVFGIAVYRNSKNSSITTTEYKEEEIGTFNKFDIDLTIADLEFKKGDAKKVVVDETKYDVHTVTVADGVLKVKGESNRKWYENIFNWNWFDKVKVTVYMPSGEYDELKVASNTGNVLVPSDFTFANYDIKVDTGTVKSTAKVQDKVTIKTSTGGITLNDCEAKSMDLDVHTGNVKLTNVNVTENIKIGTSTGDIKLENVNCADYESHSSTGELDFKKVNVTNHIEVKNGTGHVKFVESDADTLYVKTSTGDIKLQLLTSKICQVKKSTGTPHYPTSTTGGLCEVETSTGSVNITFPTA